VHRRSRLILIFFQGEMTPDVEMARARNVVRGRLRRTFSLVATPGSTDFERGRPEPIRYCRVGAFGIASTMARTRIEDDLVLTFFLPGRRTDGDRSRMFQIEARSIVRGWL